MLGKTLVLLIFVGCYGHPSNRRYQETTYQRDNTVKINQYELEKYHQQVIARILQSSDGEDSSSSAATRKRSLDWLQYPDRHGNMQMMGDVVHTMQQGGKAARRTMKISFWSQVECEVCKIVVDVMQVAFRSNKSESEIVQEVINICIDLHIEDERVCKSIVPLFKDEVLTVIDKLALSPEEICGLAISEECGTVYNPYDSWNVTLPDVPKPPVAPLHPPAKDAPKVRILQLSDIHVDRLYKAGANAKCGEPLCCRANDGPPKGEPAWKWGDYRNCDIPTWTLEHLFQHLAQNESFDYIYWTGDLPAHNVWNQTREDQLSLLAYITSLFQKYFPGKVVLPALGNHESSPVDSFPPPYITGDNAITWLYDALAQNWTNWVPQESASTIKLGAYYTFPLKSGFRVVSINTNYCNHQNWWMLLNTTDPAGELAWLIKTLQAAEDNKEKVHIIGHIPPGNGGCLKAWSWNYYKIVNRYESTITAQFFGHTHKDHFEVFYDEETLKRPTSIAYIGPSVTTYSQLNPGYRVYTVDGFYSNSTWSIVDHETHILNISEAQITDKPVWVKEYSAKETYSMGSMFPQDWDKLIGELLTNDTRFDIFYRNYNKGHPTGPCDDSCRKSMICDLRTARSNDDKLCKNLDIVYSQHRLFQLKEKLC